MDHDRSATHRSTSPICSLSEALKILNDATIASRLGRSEGRVYRRYIGMNHVGWYVPETTAELATLADLANGFDAEDVAIHEAIPGSYVRHYVHPARILASQGDSPTRAEALLGLEAQMLDAYAKKMDAPRRGAVWYALAVIPLLDAWLNGSTGPLVVGLVDPLTDQGVPVGVTVELACSFPTPGLLHPSQPVRLPPLPATLLAAHASYERLTVEAVLRGSSRIELIRALLANPLFADADSASRVVDEIIAHSPSGAAPV